MTSQGPDLRVDSVNIRRQKGLIIVREKLCCVCNCISYQTERAGTQGAGTIGGGETGTKPSTQPLMAR